MFWCSALHLINVFKHRTVVKHTHTGLQLQLVDAQSGAGQAWKPQWFSILEKHSTKTCTLTRNLSTYVCPPPQPPTDGGRKQTWKNIPAEVTVSGGGEDDHSLATDKWRFAPRLSSAPTTAPQNVFFSRWACMGYLTKIFWFFLRNLPPFSRHVIPTAAFAAQGLQGSQLSRLGGWHQLPTCQHTTHLPEKKTCVLRKETEISTGN